LSSAILYLAIVVIWACVLVPRWLHRSHDVPAAPEHLQTPLGAPDSAETDATAEQEAGAAEDPAIMSRAAQGEPAAAESEWPGWRRLFARDSRRSAPSRTHGSGRARIVQARRRMLTMLVALAAAAAGCAVARLTHWWITVPPAGMLALYLLLLREAARADGETARRQAEARATSAAQLRARAAGQAAAPRPAAEVIDISARVADQFYDQYADAAARAVGD
jgi:hypothetical protein